MKKIDFIFDWAGTLCDSFPVWQEIFRRIFEDKGKKMPGLKELRKSTFVPYMKFWEQYIPSMTQGEVNKLCEKYAVEVKSEMKTKPFEGAKETLEWLVEKGARIFVVSSDYEKTLAQEMKEFGLRKYITEHRSAVHDKDKAILELVKKYSLNPEKTFYVGDAEGDVRAGKDAGVMTIAVTWGFQDEDMLKKARPDYLIHSLSDIKGIYARE
jgi:HAD superfamily hydrolase (TIGR01549 family)